MVRTFIPFACALLMMSFALGSTGCSEDKSSASSNDETRGGDTDADTSRSADTLGDADTVEDTGGGDAVYCAALGFPVATLVSEGSSGWGEVAGSFSLNTTRGPWDLSDEWTGCDAYFFIVDNGDSLSSQLKDTLGPALFERSSRNVHYFFITASGDAVTGAESWKQATTAALNQVGDAGLRDDFSNKVHFVTDPPNEIVGSVKDFLAANAEVAAFGIDRGQRWDNPGAYYDVINTFVISSPIYGYVSRYYNFRHAQALELAGQTGVTEVAVIDQQVFAPDCMVGEECFDTPNGPFSNSNNHRVWTASFPSASEMANFDTMELVVSATCGPDNYSDCGHWDYEAFIDLCDNSACDNVLGQVARWITPYSRPGTRTWVLDASSYLGYVQAGGDQFFRFSMIWNMNPSTWDIRFRLRDAGKTTRPAETVLVHNENRGFNDTYNEGFAPLTFTPPTGTTKVEISTTISGHGQAGGNCAEWCNHQHEFTVNGTSTHMREFPGEAGVAHGCAEKVDEGVVPGQWGNWTPGRAGWCPGLPVQPWIMDITSDAQIGEENTLEYRGLFGNQAPTSDQGRIRINTVLVYHR